MVRFLMGLAAVGLVACRQDASPKGTEDPNLETGRIELGDEDGDGFLTSEGDCDDNDPNIFPGAEELCDGIDNDCNGIVDDGISTTWYQDVDGDGYGDANTSISSCTQPEGFVADNTDCNDADASYHPNAEEFCDDPNDYNCDGSVGYADLDLDGVPACEDCNDNNAAQSPNNQEVCDPDNLDEDCDGLSDDDDDSVDPSTQTITYVDSDNDGYGDDTQAILSCDGSGAAVAGDCNDADAAYHPGAAETDCTDPNDYNCDGSVGYADGDGDGYAACEECNDADAAISPGAQEICDANDVDEDCDGLVDDADSSVAPASQVSVYVDADGDGYGDDGSLMLACEGLTTGGDCNDADAAYNPGAIESDCTDPNDYNCDGAVGYVDADGDGIAACMDCNDGDASIYPGAAEVCDGIDNNCDGVVDESGTTVWYQDADGDGYGDPSSVLVQCSQPSGYVADSSDCNDGDAAYHPGAAEDCADPNDYNCDGSVGYADNDGDGVAACNDCDDSNAAISPNAQELCDANNVDEDCDGVADDADSSVDPGSQSVFYMDADGDGYGDSAFGTLACDGSGVLIGGDCDDYDAAYHPGAAESCSDMFDYNCDGSIQYADNDGDGYAACDECDDSNAAINPAAVELCNYVDDNCDGQIDETGGSSLWYADNDGDGFGDAGNWTSSCTAPPGYVSDNTDCDDSASGTYPGADEYCNGLDDNCNGLVDDNPVDGTVYYDDLDGDGYGDAGGAFMACSLLPGASEDSSDCDDSDATIHPGAVEVCDGLDDDCNGLVDDGAIDAVVWYEDADGDNYGDSSVVVASCEPPAGYVPDGGDCDDGDAAYNPGAVEDCSDPNDYNCDGFVGYADNDGDGFAACEECDDSDAAINPNAIELCDSIDNDCNGSVDDGATSTWWYDGDGDGYGDAAVSYTGCTAPTGYVSNDEDCDDSRSETHPNADEYCDGLDNDCDGSIDENPVDPGIWYADADGDGFGDAGSSVSSCYQAVGYVSDDSDCDDADIAINPDAYEICDGLDNDCDGTVDIGAIDTTIWYQDQDGDGYGDAAISSCTQPSGYVAAGGDCDDGNVAYNPGANESDCTDPNDYNCDGSVAYNDADGDGYAACEDCDDNSAVANPSGVEVCDGQDNDCDGTVDEGVENSFYYDGDGDGYGDSGLVEYACSAPAGYVSDNTDCDDTDVTIHPNASEVCDGLDNDCDGSVDEGVENTYYRDADGDFYGDSSSTTTACSAPVGYVAASGDCDDSNRSVNPGAAEVCDGLDNDCNTLIDDNPTNAQTWYLDADADGYGDANSPVSDCSQPSGTVNNDEDCDDLNAIVNPGMDEVCNGIDDNCDGIIDTDAIDRVEWYADADGDGYGDDGAVTLSCDAPAGYSEFGGDCDDNDAAYNPAAVELCSDPYDYNCDGSIAYSDADGDGYAACAECDDSNAAIHPGADEYCDGVDNDCDGIPDESDAVDASIWYADADGDTFGDDGLYQYACSQPAGYVADNTDCDDSTDIVNPAAAEVCDGLDNDCDGSIDNNAADALVWYEDADVDGYGNASVTVLACDRPAGYRDIAGDCDDGDAAYNPGAAEDCNDPYDYNCDGSIAYQDNDGDGFAACDECDDNDASIRPGALEFCDGVDNDCDSAVDESDSVDAHVWYIDIDGDTYGDPSVDATACYEPPGYTDNDLDCDDSRDNVHPGGGEVCDDLDNDCDGSIDNGAVDAPTWYEDSDGDTYGDPATAYTICDQPSGYVADGTDCDDGDTAINPGASEICDGIDNNCDGIIDSDAIDQTVWYLDSDNDSYGLDSSTVTACDAPSGYVDIGGDCNDSNAAFNPGASEVCTDPNDYNCDGVVGYSDADGDGYAACAECDDGNANVNPGEIETCNGIDDDCDGNIDEAGATGMSTWYLDSDGDGYGSTTSITACTQPTGYVSNSTDCDDTRSGVNPAATEACNGYDDDCDGSIDESGATGESTWYRDADGDGYGTSSTTKKACSKPTGYVATSTDCNDSNSAINPGAADICDTIDNNCDGTIDNGGYCPCNLHYRSGKPYLFCASSKTVINANSYCNALGYELTSVNSSSENVWLVDTAYSYYRGKWWSGGNDIAVEGTWRWYSGQSWSYSNWHSGEPNNAPLGPGGEDCMQFGRYADYTWNDEPCAWTFYFVCEGD
jgi:hypothetical protein